jgi:hypothetical protein
MATSRVPVYPFAPKTNAYLEPGQFWAVPLSDGRFACGRVLDIKRRDDGDPHAPYLGNRAFLAGLLDWTSNQPPTADSIAGARLADQDQAHIRTIQRTGGLILGHRPLQADGLRPHRWVSVPGPTPETVRYLYQGYTRLRQATPEECASLGALGAWGPNYILRRAEFRFVEGGTPLDDPLASPYK